MKIVTCGCGDTDEFSRDAFKLLFPRTPVPEITHDPNLLDNETARQMVRALKQDKRKFSLYFTEEDGALIVYDLIKGERIL